MLCRAFYFLLWFSAFLLGVWQKRVVERGFFVVNLWWIRGELWWVDGRFSDHKNTPRISHLF
jgi:hypothetical protein